MKKLFIALITIFALMQVIPYGKEHINPKVEARDTMAMV